MRNHSWSAEKLRIEESEPQPDLYEYSKEIEKEISNKEYMQFQLMTVTASIGLAGFFLLLLVPLQ